MGTVDTTRPAEGSAGGVRSAAVRAAPVALLVLAFAACYAGPVSDIDTWWHLASGRWMAEHGRVPDADPFGVFGSGNPVRTATVLTGQWLGQVAMFEAHERLGWGGLIALRVALLSACLVLVHLRARRAGASASLAAAATALAGLGLLGYGGDRPQLFSFVLAAVLMALVEALSRGRRWTLAAFPAVGALWANLHGGVLIGVAVLWVLAAAEGLRALRRGADRTPLRDLVVAAALFTAATLASPNGHVTYVYVLETQASELAARTTEYASSLRIHTLAGWERQALVLAQLAAAALVLPRLARSSPPRAAGLILLAAASAASYRYHAFLVVMGTPWIAEALAAPAARRSVREAAARGAVVLALCLLAWQHEPFAARREPVLASRVPAAAAERIRAGGLRGTVLSSFDWGGYLLWELFPAVRPFVDPRMLDDAALRPYTHMIWATPEGLAAFERLRFDLVLLPFVSPTGEVYPLHQILRARPGWRLDFAWEGGALYRRVP